MSNKTVICTECGHEQEQDPETIAVRRTDPRMAQLIALGMLAVCHCERCGATTGVFFSPSSSKPGYMDITVCIPPGRTGEDVFLVEVARYKAGKNLDSVNWVFSLEELYHHARLWLGVTKMQVVGNRAIVYYASELYSKTHLPVRNPRTALSPSGYREFITCSKYPQYPSPVRCWFYNCMSELEWLREYIIPRPEPDVHKLIEALESGEPEERAEAAEKLAKTDLEREAVPALIKALGDEDCSVRGWSAYALRMTEGRVAREAVPCLTEMLRNDEDISVRRFAADALGWLVGARNKTAMAALVDAAGDEDNELRGTTLHSLGLAGARSALPVVLKLLNDPSPWVRQVAADTLGQPKFRNAEAVGPLTKSLDDKNWVIRMLAAQSLGVLGKTATDALPKLREMLKDIHDELRETAGDALRLIQEDTGNRDRYN